jgi:hypothetical protein
MSVRIFLVHLAGVFLFGIRQMPELASANATIAAQSSVEPKIQVRLALA